MRFVHPSRSSLPAVLLTGLSLAACATGRPAGGPAAPGGGESDSPPVSAVLDSARLAQALQAATLPPADSAGPPMFAVHFAEAGTVDSVRLIAREPRPADASALERTIAEHTRPQPRRGAAWGYYLRTAGGSTRPVEISGVGIQRSPQLVNGSRISTEITRVVRQVRDGNPGYPPGRRVVLVRGVVTADGRMDVVALAAGSGDPGVDREGLRVARLTRFRPATVFGRPVPVIVYFPIAFHF